MNMVNNYTSCLILQTLLHFFFFLKAIKGNLILLYTPPMQLSTMCVQVTTVVVCFVILLKKLTNILPSKIYTLLTVMILASRDYGKSIKKQLKNMI